MQKFYSIILTIALLLNGVAFALNPDLLARQLQEKVLSTQGTLNWNQVRETFDMLLAQIDGNPTVKPLSDTQMLLPQLLNSILEADNAVATFRYDAVRRQNPQKALKELALKASVMKARLNNLKGLIDNVSDLQKKIALQGKMATLQKKILHLWLANMDFDPDSLGGNLPPMGGGSDADAYAPNFTIESTGNYDFDVYLEAQEAVKTMIQEIAQGF